MLTIKSKVCKGFVNNRAQLYSTQAPSTFNNLILNKYNLETLKQERFGKDLETYKKKYEQPILEVYLKTAEKRKREIKKLHNRNASRNRIEKKWIKIDKDMASEDINMTIERDSAETFNALLQEKEEKNPITFYDFMLGKHPLAQSLRSIKQMTNIAEPTYTGFLYEAIDSNRAIPLNDHMADQMPNKYKQSGRQWEYEKGLSKNILLQAITADLLENGLNVKEDKRLVQGSFAKVMDDDFSVGVGDDYHPLGGIDRPFENTYETTEVDNPLFLKHEDVKERRWAKKEGNHISIHDHKYPFILETADIPSLSGMKGRTENVPVDLMLRKAVLKVFVQNLDLPDNVRDRLIKLAGIRFKAKTNMIKLTSKSKVNQKENIAHVYSIFRGLISEAWKADLNYVPPPHDELEHHQQIEIDLGLEKEKEREIEENDPSNFVKNGFTFFKIYESPIKNLLRTHRSPKEIINEIGQL